MVVGKLASVTGTAEWIADAVPAGTCLSEFVMTLALRCSLPDGIVIWHEGAYYVTSGKRLEPAAAGLRVKTITNPEAHNLTAQEWVEAVLETRGIKKTWTQRYSR